MENVHIRDQGDRKARNTPEKMQGKPGKQAGTQYFNQWY